MPRYVHAVLLASALLRPASAAAGPLCSYVGTTGTLLGERELAQPCIGYGGEVVCTAVTPGVSGAGLVLVICRPAALTEPASRT